MKKCLCALVVFYPVFVFSETLEKIVAVVNDEIILLSDLRRDAVFFEQTGSLEQQIQAYIEHQLLLHEAKRFVVEPPSEAEIQRAFEAVARRFKASELQKKLREMGMTEQELRTRVTDRVWVKTFLADRIGFFIFVGDEEVKQYKADNADLSKRPSDQQDDWIRAHLKAEKEKAKTREYLEQLRSRAKIQMDPR